ATVLEALTDPTGHVRTRMAAELAGLRTRVLADDAMRARLEAWTADLVVGLVERYGPEITPVISRTIKRWDAQEASDKIELHVGRDLQFIRLNGTIVGALVGLVIHSVSLLL